MNPNTPKDNNHNNDLSYSKKDGENRITDNVELDVDSKRCTKCGIVKPLCDFTPHKDKPLGVTPQCKMCRANYYRNRYYLANKEKIHRGNEKRRVKNWEHIKEMAYKRLDPVKSRANRAVNNAKKAGKLQPPSVCERCSLAEKLDFHHTHEYDEAHWFTGVWVCRKCHAVIHKELRDLCRTN